MTSCHIEADLFVDGGYLNGIKRVYVEFGDNCEGIMLEDYQAREVADAVESIAEMDPYDPDRSEGLDIYSDGEYLMVHPDGWNVAVCINGVEVIVGRCDTREFVGELRGEDE